MSGLGKGITTSSVAKLLRLSGLTVTCIKIDPYLNVDAGTMNPVTHGEVFVTDDGGETDMDIGTYERFLDQHLDISHNITTGQVYQKVIEGERQGQFLGNCVQIIPHITNEIRNRICFAAEKSMSHVVLIECGGTVGDIESLPFLEAMRQMRLQLGSQNALFMHVTMAPELDTVGEQKTKPTQHSVQELRRIGIQPDILIVRSIRPLTKSSKEKISLFASIDQDSVISNTDAKSIYKVPEILESQKIVRTIANKLQLGDLKVKWGKWPQIAESFVKTSKSVKIAMVGKYTSLADSYVSINHSLSHAGAKLGATVKVKWIDSEIFEAKPERVQDLENYNGVLIPGGFGIRGVEGKIIATDLARRKKIPFLGLCLGFQLAIISLARHVCNLKGSNSTEFNPKTKYPVIDLLPEQKKVKNMGATMRLGGHDISIIPDTGAYNLYGKPLIRARHRHRYEFNQLYQNDFKLKNIIFSGNSDSGKRMEILELPNHPFFFATQFHPEFTCRPGFPNPIFLEFIRKCLEDNR